MASTQVLIRASEAEKSLWVAEAQRCGLTLSAWVRATLTQHAYPPDVVVAREAVHRVVAEESFKGLCARCTRLGSPSCDDCRKANPDPCQF